MFIKIESEVHQNIIGVLFQAIKEMEAKTNVRFKMLTDEKDGISIRSNYGCSSSMGRVGGIQGLSLTSGCAHMGKIMHEFMHALGIGHTHQRSDRDEYVTIIEENIKDGKLGNFAIYGNNHLYRNENNIFHLK